MTKIKVGLVDDHQLILKSLSLMLESFGEYEVTVEALNGIDLKQKMQLKNHIPDIMLIDVNMPLMNGIETAKWLSENYPSIKLVALSMNDTDQTIIQMFRAGCNAYILKETRPAELEKALKEIREKGYYNADIGNLSFKRLLQSRDEIETLKISAREKEFLTHACSEMTYKEIASKMCLSERTVDGYRESLFEKFHVQSRVGLCLEALRKGLASL
ncbi:MAG: response regulator transcription factor [Verrucomicrobia bacterium]|nr:response regulator transcription factor [Verrucomicrobiota bacterium]